ncbi:16S rRNA (cytosine(967)-C(5))-methyltransferase RsmB [Thermodesulfobacterium thermophilum]|uniref:16S rRNA (cytosine(967)-C(5))-methyltransferase RsmB n=1 Tax=Thermodesulfobacterium thermophilum TaxID=886 RepID=UPI0003B3668E|nr:16S rRNA (cytosine(967)-C(5))-methyltransferase RsmB [Thermodesulfobacterium thermophilum]
MPRLSKTNPRAVALKILIRWEKGKPLLDEVLSQVLTKSVLPDERDRALVSELVNGVVRHLYYLDFILARFSEHPLEKMDLEVKNLLRLGAYQLLYTRIPERVAIAESLKILSERKRGAWIRGLVNAVLHKVLENKDNLPEPPDFNEVYYLSVKYSFPEWLVKRWLQRFGRKETEVLLHASNERSPLVIRVNTLKVSRDSLLVYLQKDEVPTAKPCPYSPSGIILEGFRGKITELKPYHFGWISVQDSASQLVGFLLNPKPGAKVLDACAGVGGKTTHMAELMQDKGTIWAFDLYEWRLEKLKENFQRLGLKLPKVFVGDVVEKLKELQPPSFDYILIDAPCTGTGVIRKHPDVKWARTEEDFLKIPERQLRLLEGLAPFLKKGGIMVYATCSLEPEENEQVIERFLQSHPEFMLEDPAKVLSKTCPEKVKELCVENKYLRTYPHKHGLDGFFAVRLRKV